MKGRKKSKDEICEDAQLSSSLDFVLEGKYRIIFGHAEYSATKTGQELMRSLQKNDVIILNFTDESHQGLDQFWSSIR